MTGERGQSLAELALCLPAYLALVASGFTLYQLSVGRTELSLAARVGVASADPPGAVQAYLRGNRLLPPEQVQVSVQRVANLRRVSLRCEVRPLGWLGVNAPRYVISSTAARGEAILCVR
ncbi:MAG: hypothetical protein ACM3RP_02910 [Chitinophagales bacterium]